MIQMRIPFHSLNQIEEPLVVSGSNQLESCNMARLQVDVSDDQTSQIGNICILARILGNDEFKEIQSSVQTNQIKVNNLPLNNFNPLLFLILSSQSIRKIFFSSTDLTR